MLIRLSGFLFFAIWSLSASAISTKDFADCFIAKVNEQVERNNRKAMAQTTLVCKKINKQTKNRIHSSLQYKDKSDRQTKYYNIQHAKLRVLFDTLKSQVKCQGGNNSAYYWSTTLVDAAMGNMQKPGESIYTYDHILVKDLPFKGCRS